MTPIDRTDHVHAFLARARMHLRTRRELYFRWLRYRREYGELAGFSDAQLKDIGLTRSDAVFARRKHRRPNED